MNTTNAIAIIGSSFGDEGKGLMTDYFSHQHSDSGIVVRFNGGCQAGHTVVDSDTGKRHVFHHFGSGNFCGLPTYLSRYFVVHPMLIQREVDKLGGVTNTFIDEDCMVTTPYDMMINQIVERFRDKGKHGSCGIGFGETIERDDKWNIKLRVKDLNNIGYVRNILNFIRNDYIFKRLRRLGIDQLPEPFNYLCKDDGIIEQFLIDVSNMFSCCRVVNTSFLNMYNNIIFEGAQGLLLDEENMDYFPHVTRSKTGLSNVVSILNDINVECIDVTYVSRSYITRHGVGYLPHQCDVKPYNNIVDLTNIYNEYQDSIRFGLFDIDYLYKNILDDINKQKNRNVKISYNLAITCLDQIDEGVRYFKNDELYHCNKNTFLNDVRNIFKLNKIYQSYGPERKFVIFE